MDPSARPFYEMAFKLRILVKHAGAFQTFFEELMELRYGTDFRKIRPYGQDGDGACDGLIASTRQLFQVYAPKQIKAGNTIAKINHDFERACTEWGRHFDTWIFLHNDPNGLPPQVDQRLLTLNGTHGKQVIAWSPFILRQVVFALSDDNLALLLGPPMNWHVLASVTPEDIRVIIDHLATSEVDPLEPLEAVPRGKIEYNQLSTKTVEFLRVGYRQTRKVAEQFRLHSDPTRRDRIAKRFQAEYQALRSAGLPPDDIFAGLWAFTSGSESQHCHPARKGAELAVLAFFFESCDIFERPPEGGATP